MKPFRIVLDAIGVSDQTALLVLLISMLVVGIGLAGLLLRVIRENERLTVRAVEAERSRESVATMCFEQIRARCRAEAEARHANGLLGTIPVSTRFAFTGLADRVH